MWTRNKYSLLTLSEKWDAIVLRVRERIMSDRTIANGVSVRRIVETPTALALDRVVDVVTKSIANDENSFSSAEPRSASSLIRFAFLYFLSFDTDDNK